MIIQLINDSGRVIHAMQAPKHDGAPPQWVFLNGTVFIFRARVGNLYRFVEAPGLIMSKQETPEVLPSTLIAN